jgi:hypothetical protein
MAAATGAGAILHCAWILPQSSTEFAGRFAELQFA